MRRSARLARVDRRVLLLLDIAMRLLRPTLLASATLLLAATSAFAQEAEGGSVNLLSPSGGLMFWTLIIFVLLLLLLSKFAFPPILGAVEARERSLQEAIEGAKADREAAAALMAQQRADLDRARTEAQQLIADGRAAGEKLRADMLEQTRVQQQELLERARREIDAERERAIQELRREAVDLAIAGASRVIEQNLDDAANRQLIDRFLATVPPTAARR
jgi:F-type H+-transporting ATPase subunit b